MIDMWNLMAARGPNFHTYYVDELPTSNAEIGMTTAQLLELHHSRGCPSIKGWKTILRTQAVGP
jgi:hypothetical protein